MKTKYHLGVERLWPVLFHWDGLYWFGAMLFAVSGGYTASLALMYCPRYIKQYQYLWILYIYIQFNSIDMTRSAQHRLALGIDRFPFVFGLGIITLRLPSV